MSDWVHECVCQGEVGGKVKELRRLQIMHISRKFH